MTTTKGYSLQSTIGTFTMRPDDAGAWRVYCGDEELGAYPDAETAARELASGDACWPQGVDPSTLGLPDGLKGWTAMGTEMSGGG